MCRRKFCDRNIVSKDKISNYFIPAAIENNVKETNHSNIMIIL